MIGVGGGRFVGVDVCLISLMRYERPVIVADKVDCTAAVDRAAAVVVVAVGRERMVAGRTRRMCSEGGWTTGLALGGQGRGRGCILVYG